MITGVQPKLLVSFDDNGNMQLDEMQAELIGWCIERTIYRVNESGINEPYTMYEPLK